MRAASIMVAVPYTGNLVLRGLRTGAPYTFPLSGSDANGAFVTNTKTSETTFQVPEDCLLVDMVLLVGGTDVNHLDLWVRSADSGHSFVNDQLLPSVPRPRVPEGIVIAANAPFMLKQRA